MTRLKVAFADPAENSAYRAFYFNMGLTCFRDDRNNWFVNTENHKIRNLEPFSNSLATSPDAIARLARDEIDLAIVENAMVEQARTRPGANSLQVRAVLDFADAARDAPPFRLAAVTKAGLDPEMARQAALVTELVCRKYKILIGPAKSPLETQDKHHYGFMHS